jgi:hypothetical protein
MPAQDCCREERLWPSCVLGVLSNTESPERWVYDPYFQYFTGEEFFQHAFPHERSDLSHWRKRLGEKLELLLAESLRVAHKAGGRLCSAGKERTPPRCGRGV